MMMTPRALALGAGIVLVAGIVLHVAIGGDDMSMKPVARFAQAEPGNPTGSSPPVPRLSAPGATTGGNAAVTDHMVGGARIRDHRSGERTVDDVPPVTHPPGGRKIASQLTSDLAQQVRAVIDECATALPANARGPEPRLDGTIAIAIQHGQATITSATVQLRDVNAAATDSLKHCIEQRSVGIAASAGNEPELSGYAITLAFRVP